MTDARGRHCTQACLALETKYNRGERFLHGSSSQGLQESQAQVSTGQPVASGHQPGREESFSRRSWPSPFPGCLQIHHLGSKPGGDSPHRESVGRGENRQRTEGVTSGQARRGWQGKSLLELPEERATQIKLKEDKLTRNPSSREV